MGVVRQDIHADARAESERSLTEARTARTDAAAGSHHAARGRTGPLATEWYAAGGVSAAGARYSTGTVCPRTARAIGFPDDGPPTTSRQDEQCAGCKEPANRTGYAP